LTYVDKTFLPMFNEFGGFKRITREFDFLLALIIGISSAIIVGYLDITTTIINTLCPLFITISATMIAIAIAGLAIIASLSDPNFIKILKKVDIYNRILFFFYFSAVISGLSIIVNIFTYISPFFIHKSLIFTILLGLSTFLVLYSLFAVILLVGTTMRYGIYRGAFITEEKIS